ncbi:MAG: ATP-dependent Clp protease adaptor ClpS [Sulfuricurvum sp.]|uniref:ATP-dependent Clp protease adaptor ClpS n=1 Tax=Sulfuricurvum sp. TaxID=2025608 RepID=UPI0026350F19|nr:ATP-dependent Clp protease adaptor ClpS [Sulfuricurvum sp.]MDD2829759.1 ATP-dependent Clp protease adaptor ClpS [Sulfuricurvum sp.]MDD4948489.1 ATP-dependent Clp protease adaptor ClpS [Sulfuricurvum sp.]
MSTKTEHQHEHSLDLREPKKYHVYLLNDDYTSMEFVIDILMGIFRKSYSQAHQIMMQVHQSGRGLCGTYSYEIAETKIHQVSSLARESGYPLKAILEEAS